MRIGYPTVQDSKTVKVRSQAKVGIFFGEKSYVSLSARSKFNVRERGSRTITRVCPSMAAETSDLGLPVDAVQFYSGLLWEILGETAPPPQDLHLSKSRIQWPRQS